MRDQKTIEAWLGVGLIILGIGGFLFFNKSEQEATNPDLNSKTQTATSSLIFQSEILQSRSEKLEKIKGQADYENLKKQIDSQLIQDVEAKTAYAPGNNKPFLITQNTNEEQYKKDFAKAFENATSSGMGLELVYFISQMSPDTGEILPFSPQDTESIFRIATEYELFADTIQKLATPETLSKVGEITSEKARTAAYYLRKMMEEKDPFLYSVYFSKYTEATSYILKINKTSNKQLNELDQLKALASSTEKLLER